MKRKILILMSVALLSLSGCNEKLPEAEAGIPTLILDTLTSGESQFADNVFGVNMTVEFLDQLPFETFVQNDTDFSEPMCLHFEEQVTDKYTLHWKYYDSETMLLDSDKAEVTMFIPLGDSTFIITMDKNMNEFDSPEYNDFVEDALMNINNVMAYINKL